MWMQTLLVTRTIANQLLAGYSHTMACQFINIQKSKTCEQIINGNWTHCRILHISQKKMAQQAGIEFSHQIHSIPIFTDNQSAIAYSKNEMNNSWTKHIDIHYHYMGYAGNIKLIYVKMAKNPANILTNPLSPCKHLHILELLGIHQAWGGVLRRRRNKLQLEEESNWTTYFLFFFHCFKHSLTIRWHKHNQTMPNHSYE